MFFTEVVRQHMAYGTQCSHFKVEIPAHYNPLSYSIRELSIVTASADYLTGIELGAGTAKKGDTLLMQACMERNNISVAGAVEKQDSVSISQTF